MSYFALHSYNLIDEPQSSVSLANSYQCPVLSIDEISMFPCFLGWLLQRQALSSDTALCDSEQVHGFLSEWPRSKEPSATSPAHHNNCPTSCWKDLYQLVQPKVCCGNKWPQNLSGWQHRLISHSFCSCWPVCWLAQQHSLWIPIAPSGSSLGCGRGKGRGRPQATWRGGSLKLLLESGTYHSAHQSKAHGQARCQGSGISIVSRDSPAQEGLESLADRKETAGDGQSISWTNNIIYAQGKGLSPQDMPLTFIRAWCVFCWLSPRSTRVILPEKASLSISPSSW